jgi:hypothetical protein
MPGRSRNKRHEVLYARINRRREQSLGRRPFVDEMLALVEGKNMRAERNDHVWIAADLELTDDDLLTGIIGYETTEIRTRFNETEWSWLKGERHIDEGASDATLSPFAIDLNEHRRWVAFAPSGYLNARSFPGGFQTVLNEALRQQNEGHTDWEVDMISSVTALREWVASHGEIVELKLTIRQSNPGRNLDNDRAQMQALRARSKTEVFHPYWGRALEISDEQVEELAADMERTNVDVQMKAREGNRKPTFNSKNNRAQTFIEEYAEDLRLGIELVSETLKSYSIEHPGDEAEEEG